MGGTEVRKPTEPLFAAIEPFLRKAISLWNFYWKMAWRPGLFAEEYLLLPTASSITKAVKHSLWLAGFWSALQGFLVSANGLMGYAKSESALESFGTTFVFVVALALQAVPMAGMLWLLTRRYATSISQAVIVNVYWINLFLASTLLVFTVMYALAVPFQVIIHKIVFLPIARVADERSFETWFRESHYWKWYLSLLILMGVSCLSAWGRIFFFVGPTLIAGTIKNSFWQGFWRFFPSVAATVIVIKWLIFPLLFLVSGPDSHQVLVP
jgi:hypothetical protein